jgi:hypothetical protein
VYFVLGVAGIRAIHSCWVELESGERGKKHDQKEYFDAPKMM